MFFRAITPQCRNQNDFQLHEAEPPTNFAQAQARAEAHRSIWSSTAIFGLSIKEVPFLFSDKSNHFGAVVA